MTVYKSPCIGICSTAQGDDICRGCGRTFYEVTNWSTLTEKELESMEKRLNDSITSAFNSCAKITSVDKMLEAYNKLPPRFENRSLECKAYYVLNSCFASKSSILGIASKDKQTLGAYDIARKIRQVLAVPEECQDVNGKV